MVKQIYSFIQLEGSERFQFHMSAQWEKEKGMDGFLFQKKIEHKSCNDIILM